VALARRLAEFDINPDIMIENYFYWCHPRLIMWSGWGLVYWQDFVAKISESEGSVLVACFLFVVR
jgi:hypothetical protein